MTRTYISDEEDQSTNLRNFIRGITVEEWQEGERWYRDAHLWCSGLAQEHALPTWKICGVVAAMSPRQHWEQNKWLAEMIAIMWSARVDHDVMRKLPAFSSNIAKAIDILMLSDDIPEHHVVSAVANILNGNKTIAFFENMLYPDRSVLVTIDVWMYRILEGSFDSVLNRLTDEDYEQMERVIIDMAQEYGVLPSVLQAVTWVSARNRYNSKLRKAKTGYHV